MARDTSMPVVQPAEARHEVKTVHFVRSQSIGLPSPKVQPQLVPTTPTHSPAKSTQDEEAIRRLFLHVGTLADLANNPRKWSPSELGLFLVHTLHLTAPRLVSDLLDCLLHKGLTGRRFLRLRERDFRQELGFSVAWASMLAAAQQQLRMECSAGRVSDSIEEEEEDELAPLPATTKQRNKNSWRSSWRRSSGLQSRGRVKGMTALFETSVDSSSDDGSDSSVSDAESEESGDSPVVGRWSEVEPIEVTPEVMDDLEEGVQESTDSEADDDPFLVAMREIAAHTDEEKEVAIIEYERDAADEEARLEAAEVIKTEPISPSQVEPDLRYSTASSYVTCYEDTPMARDISFDTVKHFSGQATPPTSEDSRLDSLFEKWHGIEPLRSVTGTRLTARRAELEALHLRLDEMQQSIDELAKRQKEPSASPTPALVTEGHTWLEFGFTVAIVSVGFGVILAEVAIKALRR